MTRQIEYNKRDFSTPLFRKFRDFHLVILRLQAENPVVRTDGTALFLASFLKNRLLDIDLELRNLSKKIKADEDKARQKD
jgi:hypothetical protein